MMNVRDDKFGKEDAYEAYMTQINWDWIFLKGLLIFSTVLVLGLLGFAFWFMD